MKVKVLIELLQKQNPDLEVVRSDDDRDVEVMGVSQGKYDPKNACVGVGDEYTEEVILIE